MDNSTNPIFRDVSSSKSKSVDDIRSNFENASKLIQNTFSFFLINASNFPEIELMARNQGISAYGFDGERRRECFHFGIRRKDLVVYQHGEASDPKNIFNRHQPGSKRHRYGYISGADKEENEYALNIFSHSYEKITGRCVTLNQQNTSEKNNNYGKSSPKLNKTKRRSVRKIVAHKDPRAKSEFLPCSELRQILLSAYAPCHNFKGACQEDMRWNLRDGHIPRGFAGATGKLKDIKLVLVVAEPGNPHSGESYKSDTEPIGLLAATSNYTYKCFENGQDQFHRNVRYILDSCWPDLSFHEQMKRTWITESVLCSAETEGASVKASVYKTCVQDYLLKQIELLPDCTVVALGYKAQQRLKKVPTVVKATSVAPPGCNTPGAKESWNQITKTIRGLI